MRLSSTPERERSLTQTHSLSATGTRLRISKEGWPSVKQKHQQDRVGFQHRRFILIFKFSAYTHIYSPLFRKFKNLKLYAILTIASNNSPSSSLHLTLKLLMNSKEMDPAQLVLPKSILICPRISFNRSF